LVNGLRAFIIFQFLCQVVPFVIILPHLVKAISVLPLWPMLVNVPLSDCCQGNQTKKKEAGNS